MKYCFIILASTLFGLMACNPQEEELFEMQMELDFNLISGLNSFETHGFIIEDITSTFQSIAASKGVSLDNIGRLSPTIATLEGVFVNYDYSIIEWITIDLVNSEDENDKREIFYQEIIPLNHDGPIQLFGSITDLQNVLKNDFYDLHIEVKLKSPTTTLLENRIVYNFVAYKNE
jgi:hypothetical protein